MIKHRFLPDCCRAVLCEQIPKPMRAECTQRHGEQSRRRGDAGGGQALNSSRPVFIRRRWGANLFPAGLSSRSFSEGGFNGVVVLPVREINALFGVEISNQCSPNPYDTIFWPLCQHTFPNSNNAPPNRVEFTRNPEIAISIASDFFPPLRGVALRIQVATTIVTMPKATINKYGQLRLRKNEIRIPQQWKAAPPSMQPFHAKERPQL